MSKVFLVIGNIAAHSGHIAVAGTNQIWSNENPNGWTYQDYTGPHGTVLLETEDEQEAEQRLEKFLECDSVENGTYCYTHNPTAR